MPYLLPKDPLEDQRLNYQHHALARTLSNHYLAPLAPGTRTILDVGTGTGIWAFEMQALFPHALIVGVDVSLASMTQPVPPPCLFVRANILEGLPFPDEQFTYTHQRLLVAAIPAQAWPGVVCELVRVTRPGGWIELLELSDGIQPAGPATRLLLDWFADDSQQLEAVPVTTRSLAPVRTRSPVPTWSMAKLPDELGQGLLLLPLPPLLPSLGQTSADGSGGLSNRARRGNLQGGARQRQKGMAMHVHLGTHARQSFHQGAARRFSLLCLSSQPGG